VIDAEAESDALRQRSVDLGELLDAGHPVVGGGSLPEVAESRRLGQLAHQARQTAAARVAAGLDPGCVVGRQPPVRRTRTDRHGRDLDPFHGAAVVTDELVAYWEHRRDVVAPAVEAQYRRAATDRPYREALVAAARGHIAVLRERQAMLSEGGLGLEAALARYDEAFLALRQAANDDAQTIANEAETRLASLRREAAQALVGGDEVKGFLGATLASVTDVGVVDPDTALPLVAVDARTGWPVRAG
jgi:hypothetical protein